MTAPPLDLWGVSAELRPLTGGSRNTVLRTVGLDRELVFKTTTRSAEAINWLTAVHQYATSAGFVVPHHIASLRGALVEAGWTCEPLIDGRPFSARDLAAVAPMMAAFHGASTMCAQRPGFRASADLLSDDAGGDVDLSVMPEALVTACRAAWARVAGSPAAVVHGDLTPANLMWAGDGRPALLDWDECRRDLTLFDTVQIRDATAEERNAALAWEVACCWSAEPGRARQLAAKLLA